MQFMGNDRNVNFPSGIVFHVRAHNWYLGEYYRCLNVVFMNLYIFTARKRSCGKVMFSQPSVILSTGGGVCLSWGRPTPPPKKADHPLGRMQTPS